MLTKSKFSKGYNYIDWKSLQLSTLKLNFGIFLSKYKSTVWLFIWLSNTSNVRFFSAHTVFTLRSPDHITILVLKLSRTSPEIVSRKLPPTPSPGNLPPKKCLPPEICPTPRNVSPSSWKSARPKSLGKYETVRYSCIETYKYCGHKSASVICIHCPHPPHPQPTGMGGDNDFSKSKQC